MRNSDIGKKVCSRRGSQIVEATMVLPLTILIMAALICLMLMFYTDFLEQTAQHEAERNELYEKQETTFLRMGDAVSALKEVNMD